MDTHLQDLNESVGQSPKVISLKVPEWLFNTIEGFREKYNMETRNAALSVLVAAGLEKYGMLGREQYQRFTSGQGTDRRFKGRT